MENLKRALSRVRWTSVIALFLVIVVFTFILFNLPSKYNVQGSIGVNAKAKPDRIAIGERAEIKIELKNMNKNDEARVDIEVRTYDEKFVFVRTGSKYAFEPDVLIGPQETREIKFSVRALSGALPGRYRVDITAMPKSYAEGAKDKVYIVVSDD